MLLTALAKSVKFKFESRLFCLTTNIFRCYTIVNLHQQSSICFHESHTCRTKSIGEPLLPHLPNHLYYHNLQNAANTILIKKRETLVLMSRSRPACPWLFSCYSCSLLSQSLWGIPGVHWWACFSVSNLIVLMLRMLTSLFVQVVSKSKYLLQTLNSRNGQHLLWVQLQGMLFVCNSTISLSIAAWLEGQSCMTVGVREDTTIWKGFSIKLKISSCSFPSLNVDSNSPLSSSKTSKKSSVAEVLLQEWVNFLSTVTWQHLTSPCSFNELSELSVVECSGDS